MHREQPIKTFGNNGIVMLSQFAVSGKTFEKNSRNMLDYSEFLHHDALPGNTVGKLLNLTLQSTVKAGDDGNFIFLEANQGKRNRLLAAFLDPTYRAEMYEEVCTQQAFQKLVEMYRQPVPKEWTLSQKISYGLAANMVESFLKHKFHRVIDMNFREANNFVYLELEHFNLLDYDSIFNDDFEGESKAAKHLTQHDLDAALLHADLNINLLGRGGIA